MSNSYCLENHLSMLSEEKSSFGFQESCQVNLSKLNKEF